MKIGFYPGCSLNGTSREYNESVKALAQVMGLELIELKDWNCCGATAAHSMSKQLSLALPTRVLALAEQQGFQEIVVPCASCYNRLSVAQYELLNNEVLKDEILTTVGMRYLGNVKILNVIQMIEKYMLDALKEKIVRPFAHQVACYYGCLLVRPHKISRTDLVGRLSGNILKDADDRGAEAVIVACPMCHSNLDMRRPAINHYLAKTVTIPVLYITQAIGLAVGLTPKELGLGRHFVAVNLKEAEVCLK